MKKRIVLAAAALPVLLAGILIIIRFIPSKRRMDAAVYFGVREGEVGVSVNGTPTGSCGKLFDGEVYLDIGSARAVNPSVFLDETEDRLIITTPTEKHTWPVRDGYTAGEQAVREDGTVYLPLSLLEELSDASFALYSEPDRVTAWTERDCVSETFASDAPVRFRAGIRSPVISDGKAGSSIYVTDVSADGEPSGDKLRGWTHVVTEDGFSGYVEDRFLENPVSGTRSWESPVGTYTSLLLDEPVNMVFHQTTDQASNNALEQSMSGISGVNVIAPTWFFLDGTNGEVSSIASSSYVETAHAAGLKVFAVLNDFDGGISSAADTAAALSSDTSRSAIISSVMQGIRESGADGLNLDIELVSRSSAADYLELVREFSVECRNDGIVLSADNYVPAFTSYFDRKEQARVIDYLVVMCYDEHTAGSEEAGSVSSLPFVRKGIEETVREAGAEKTIAALPFYTRMWETDAGGAVSSRAYGMRGAAEAMASLGMTASFDEKTSQNYAEKKTEGTTYRIWVEDAVSVEEKMKVVKELGVAGVAEWKLGLETPDIWDVIRDYLF